jgi:hypothetical protein
MCKNESFIDFEQNAVKIKPQTLHLFIGLKKRNYPNNT